MLSLSDRYHVLLQVLDGIVKSSDLGNDLTVLLPYQILCLLQCLCLICLHLLIDGSGKIRNTIQMLRNLHVGIHESLSIILASAENDLSDGFLSLKNILCRDSATILQIIQAIHKLIKTSSYHQIGSFLSLIQIFIVLLLFIFINLINVHNGINHHKQIHNKTNGQPTHHRNIFSLQIDINLYSNKKDPDKCCTKQYHPVFADRIRSIILFLLLLFFLLVHRHLRMTFSHLVLISLYFIFVYKSSVSPFFRFLLIYNTTKKASSPLKRFGSCYRSVASSDQQK